MAGMATGVAALASASSSAGGVSGRHAVASRTSGLVGNARAVKRVAITCVAKGASQSSVQSVQEPVQSKSVEKLLNPAEELLEAWARQPAVGSGGRSSETEAVRRLFLWDALPKKEEVQLFSVYEINEHDRDSPAILPFSTINIAKFSNSTHNLWSTLTRGLQHGLGDLVPFSNKIYDSSLRMRLGVTAGMTMVVKNYPGKGPSHLTKQRFFSPDRYEAMYTFYLGDMGHVSAQGPFTTFEDTLLTITGGAGLFREAKGVVHLHNITPFKLFYTFHVRGVAELPSVLTSTPVEPSESVQPCVEAAACKPGFALPNYTD